MSEPTVTIPDPPICRRWPWAVVLASFFLVHTIQSARLFPSLKSIVDRDSPIVVVDHAIHEYHGELGARFFREGGTTAGFDPYFMAGYPETPVWDSSSNPSILFDLLGGAREGDYRAYKVGVFLATVFAVAVVAGASWAAGLGWAEAAIGFVLAWFYFWTGFPPALWRSGLFAFVSASAGVSLLLGLCVRFDRRPSWLGWLMMTGAGMGLFFLHVTAPIMAGGGALAFYLSVARRHGWKWHLAVVGSVVMTVVANLPWLLSLWHFRAIRTSSGMFMTTDSARFFLDYYRTMTVDGRTGLVLMILGGLAMIRWSFDGRRAAAAAFGGSIVSLILLFALGSLWGPTRTLEPLRFRVSYGLLLAVPAGSLVIDGCRWLARRSGGGWRGVLAIGFVLSTILGGWFGLEPAFFRASWNELATYRPMVVGVPPEGRMLVDWLKANTDQSARILFEDQLRLLEPTDPESVHWTPMLPSLLRPERRMFIGGLYQTAFIKHHEMAAFGDFQLGDRPIDQWTPAELNRYCEVYNVGWVVCWSPLSRFWFDSYTPAVRVATVPRHVTLRPPRFNQREYESIGRRVGPNLAKRYLLEGEGSYAIYEVNRPHSYFLKGKGRLVDVEPNSIELADVELDDGAAILDIHWIDTWQSDPPTTLRPELVAPDPIPFIRIEADGPIPRLVLSNRPR